jgi:hypothetical protein
MLKKIAAMIRGMEGEDFAGLYMAAPISFAEEFPEVPKPAPRLSPDLLAAQWVSRDLYGENMPSVAADLLEAGFDGPSLRRLAGEMRVACAADVEDLVGKMFCELSVPYPLTATEAKLIITRQIGREVIHGECNAWAASAIAGFLSWDSRSEIPDLWTIYLLNEELDCRYSRDARPIAIVTSELIDAFARLGALAEGEKRPIRFGLLEGEGWIADDFNAPLPDDLLAQFEGRNDPEKG